MKPFHGGLVFCLLSGAIAVACGDSSATGQQSTALVAQECGAMPLPNPNKERTTSASGPAQGGIAADGSVSGMPMDVETKSGTDIWHASCDGQACTCSFNDRVYCTCLQTFKSCCPATEIP